jgi:hypothetical protein
VLSNGRITISGSTELAPGGQAVATSTSRAYEQRYDEVGHAVARIGFDYLTNGFSLSRSLFDQRGQETMALQAIPLNQPTVEGSTAWWSSPTERRDYDAMGRLTQVSTFFDVGQLEYSSAGTLSVRNTGQSTFSTEQFSSPGEG